MSDQGGADGVDELGGVSTPPPPADGPSEILDTVSGFEAEARKDHVRLKHGGDWETCSEETCVDARDLLSGR